MTVTRIRSGRFAAQVVFVGSLFLLGDMEHGAVSSRGYRDWYRDWYRHRYRYRYRSVLVGSGGGDDG